MNQYFNGNLSYFLTEVSFDTSEEKQQSYFQKWIILKKFFDDFMTTLAVFSSHCNFGGLSSITIITLSKPALQSGKTLNTSYQFVLKPSQVTKCVLYILQIFLKLLELTPFGEYPPLRVRLSGAEWLFAITIRQRKTLAINCEDIFWHWHFSNTTNPICLFLRTL